MLNRLILISWVICTISACDTQSTSSSQHNNVIQDKIYSDQFDSIQKAKQVENVLLDAAQTRREAIDAQTH